MSTRQRNRKQSATQNFWATTPAERAFFEDGYMGYVVVLGAIAIFTVELTANVVQGSGTVSLIHFFIVGSLYVFLVLLFARAVIRAVQRR
jgi:hypothetical protein